MTATAPWYLDGVGRFMGFRHQGPGRIALTVRPELINSGGLLAGPVAFALLDYAMGSALWEQTTDEEHIATLNLAINYVATVRDGEVVGTATLDRRNRRSAVLRGEVTAGDGRLLATGIGSFSIFPARPGRRRSPGAEPAP